MTPKVMSELAVKRILVADDDQYVRGQLKEFFASLGYQVDAAENGCEVLAKVQDAEYAVVLLGCGPSQEDGLKLLGGLFASHPDISVVMLSAESRLETVTAALGKGAVDFVVKPLDLNELTEIVQKAYDRYELLRMYQVMSRQMQDFKNPVCQKGSAFPKTMADVSWPAKEGQPSVDTGRPLQTVGQAFKRDHRVLYL